MSMERYMKRRHQATLDQLRLKNALSLRPNHRLIIMQHEVAGREPPTVEVDNRGRIYTNSEKKKKKKKTTNADTTVDNANGDATASSKLPHFMTATEAYAIETETKNKVGKRKNLEGRPSLKEVRDLFRDADRLAEGVLSPRTACRILEEMDFVVDPNEIVTKCKLAIRSFRKKRRETLSSYLPDDQAGTIPSFLRKRSGSGSGRAAADVKVDDGHEDEEEGLLDLDGFVHLYLRLCAEQPLETSNPWDRPHREEGAPPPLPPSSDVSSVEEGLIRLEDKWDISTDIPKQHLRAYQIHTRKDIFTHQPMLNPNIP
eukprot:g5248.t1